LGGLLNFTPYASHVHLSFSREQSGAEWKKLIECFLDELGQKCAEEKSVIGHIKCLSRLPGGGYIRGSKVSPDYPADVDLITGTHPMKEMKLTLNVLVYGLCTSHLSQLVEKTAREIAESWRGEVKVYPVLSCDGENNGHDNEHQHH